LQLRPILHHIDDTEVQQLASAVLDDFEKRVLPAFPGLRKQLIHSDANPENVLLDTDEIGVTGFIDFGDMLRAPLVVDVAVAASYLRAFEGDALQFILPFVAGYHSVTNLDAPEIELLFDLIRARLVTSLSMLHWRLSVRSEDDAYRQSTLSQESGAQVFLARLDDVGRKAFDQALREAV
jgi:Ser/Thr protein kinase RdoA (MazF antagonist)